MSYGTKMRRSQRQWALHVALAVMMLLGLTGSAVAQDDLPRQPYLPLDLALQAASAALEQCQDDGYRVSVAVVDRNGVLKVLLKDDGTGPHTVGSSTRKAYTSASLGRTTQELAKTVAGNPEVEGLRNMDPQILILAGGVPISATIAATTTVVIGGIGVGGAPGGHLDEACARAGIESIRDELQ